MNLDYRILGPLEVWAGGRRLDIGGARQRRLLGALILAGGRPLSAHRLVDVVWVGDPPARARNTLRTYIARARRVLEAGGESPLVTDQNGWRLQRSPDSLDSTRFETLLASARAMSADPMSALTSLEEALSLWRDDALVEFRDEDWCAGEAVRLDELRIAAEEERFEAMLGCGLYDDVISELEQFTGRHPLRDRARAQHMVALYRAGRQVDAVRAFQSYRQYLLEEIGVEASDELRSLERRIVERDPALRQLAPDGRRLRSYQLGPAIGHGAFGRIYRATQPVLGREVAIKVVRPELADDPEFIRRFDSEARTIARLEHPHIVPLFDYWREPGGAYLVMRYLRGGNARQLVDFHGPLPIERVGRLVEQVGSALATAHAAGVVHRDVKPENILYDEHGNAYLGDFGIAQPRAPDGVTDVGSASNVVYASPEQVRGEATAQSDVYALGVVLFELLTGQAPFSRQSTAADAVEHAPDSVPNVTAVRPDLPAALDEVLRRATSPEPADRFTTVGDLVVAFRTATEPADRPPSLGLGWQRRNPYKGLAAFDEADGSDFFGRDALVDQLRAATARSRFVAVVGPSGSGKSSAVRAGLLPQLRHSGAYVATMIPGAHPMQELARAVLEIAPASHADEARAALGDSGEGLVHALDQCVPDSHELVLVVDQFEELFTLSDEAARESFLRSISTAAGDQHARIRVIATIRADFYDRPLSDDLISELVRANTVAVTPLGPAELALAITAPAERVGVKVEPALVAALVADAARASMALPLVQFELTSLFDHRDGDTLTLATYRLRGGLGGAIARRADEIFEGCDAAGRHDVRRLFGRLIAPGDRDDDSNDTRRRVRSSELAAIPAELVDAFIEARLLTVDRDAVTREPTVEIAHEALIREWPRLRSWVDADRDGIRMLRHLTAAATAWDTAGRDPGELYRGGRLLTAEEWVAGHVGELNEVEQDFLDESVRVRDAEQVREQRRVRRLRALVSALGVVAVVAVVAGLVAVRESRIADDNAAEAERRALENRASQLMSESSLALAGGDPDVAILLALAAHDVSSALSDTPQPGIVALMHEVVQGSRLERVIAGGYSAIAVSPSGRTVALDHLPEKNRLASYDIETGDLLRERTLESNIGGLAYSPDGSLLAVSFCCTEQVRGVDRSAMLLLDAGTLETVEELDGGVESWSPSWSADGDRVLSLGWTGVRVWRRGESAVEQTIANTDVASVAAFVPGTSSIAVVSTGRLHLIDANTGEMRADHEVPLQVETFRVSPAGDRVAFVDGEAGVVRVVDIDSGETLTSIDFPSPEELQFSPDGTSVAVAGNTDVVRVVSLESSDAIELRGHGTGVWGAAYSPGGRLLVAMRDGGTRVWNLDRAGPREIGSLTIDGQPRGGQSRADSSLLVSVETGVEEGHVVLLDVGSSGRRVVADFWFPGFAWPVYSPDGALVAGYSLDSRTPTVFDVETGGEVATMLRPCETPRAIDRTNRWILVDGWCPDEAQSAADSGSRTGFVDFATGELIGEAGTDEVFAAAIGPPGTLASDVVAYTTHSHVVFRRASTFELITEWRIPSDVITLTVDFSPDGSALGVSSQARQGIVFDVAAIVAGATADDAVVVYPELHSGPTHRVVPIGDSIFTTGANTQVRQWDPVTGTLLVDIPTELGAFVHLFPLPDGSALFYADANGVLRRYLTDPDDLVTLARSRVQRSFTEAECARFFPDGDCPG